MKHTFEDIFVSGTQTDPSGARGSTNAEIDARCDDSAMVETRTGAGAISITVAETRLVTTGADALTIAAPTKPGMIKVIK